MTTVTLERGKLRREGAGVLRLRLCGGVHVEVDGTPLPESLLAGRQGRLVLAYLVCTRPRNVPREELAELLWADRLPESWPASLSAVISRLRRLLGEAGLDGASALRSSFGAYRLELPDDAWIDWEQALTSVEVAEQAVADGDTALALKAASEAGAIAGHGFLTDDCAWVDDQREVARDICVRAALAQAEAHVLAGSAARAVEAARDAVALDPLREAGYRLLMRALALAGERAEALRVWERCRATLVEELGVDPAPETEAVYLDVLGASGPSATVAAAVSATPVTTELPSGVVTFLLTDIVESSALWDREPAAMAAALERHDALVEEVVTAHGGTLLKSKLEGDATVSVFGRATAGAFAALALRDALQTESWPEGARPLVRMALHTGEAFERAGDYFGPALNRAARLRSLAGAAQVLLSQAVAELVRDHLPEGVSLVDRGHRDLRGLSRGENVYELAPVTDDAELGGAGGGVAGSPAAVERPPVPAALAPSGPFVGRDEELARLSAQWDNVLGGKPQAILLAGEPGVGKSRLAAECARMAYEQGAIVLYGRCDEELGAPFQPFVEAVRTAVPVLGPARLRGVRGVDELIRLVPELASVLPDAAPVLRADPDTERYALFDAFTQLTAVTSVEAPVLLVLDDLHWAGKTTLALLRHVLRNAEAARLLVIGTYRDTELARTHPLASTLADLRSDGTAERVTLSGLEPDAITDYLHAVGHDDRALGRELAKVTSGNPFFLIEALRHLEESGGTWEPGSLPQGVREATGRRLSRLSDTTNDALSVAAVAGTSFSLDLIERVRGAELVEEMAEACQAGLVIEEVGALGVFRFAHALVRQVLLAELVTVKRVRMHRTIAELLEANPGPDPDVHLADLAYHWFECASTGSADKAVEACRRAADRALERLAYEEAADLYGMAIQALDGTDHVASGDLADLHLARCDALLTSGEVSGARAALEDLRRAAAGSDRLEAWHATFAGQLTVLAEPDRLTEIVESVGEAARAMRAVDDVTGEAKAHYVHALALERLGQIGAAERALDSALAAARTSGNRRLADAILAEAPPAALWGPSPVTRASGRCLDVVRVLRITAGAPAVEAVALRCQAVLEALRGRMDAARRMVSSARRTVDQLGLALRRLEADISAGMIELLDGQAVEAERYLRAAYEDLRDRGLGGEAAQAAALLGRALLMQGRDEDAEHAATEAERLAGADLKAAIGWRGVLAEVAANRGDTALAFELARTAVDLAIATDALLLVADARLALAAVLRASGDTAAADAEAQRAVDVCEAKGATVLAARARAASQLAKTAAPGDVERRHRQVRDNLATRNMRTVERAINTGDAAAVAALTADNCTWERFGVGHRDSPVETLLNHARSGSTVSFEVVATLGSHLALALFRESLPPKASDSYGETSVDQYVLVETNDQGHHQRVIDFRTAELDHAVVALYRWHGEREGSTRSATIASSLERRLTPAHPSDDVVALTERGVLLRQSGRFVLVDFGPDGTSVETESFSAAEAGAAIARLDQLDGAPVHLENTATRTARAIVDAINRADEVAATALLAPSFHSDDRRSVIGTSLDPKQSIDNVRLQVASGMRRHMEPIATRGDRLLLAKMRWEVDGTEIEMLTISQVDDAGRWIYGIAFDVDDLGAAYGELDRLHAASEPVSTSHDRFETQASRLVREFERHFNAREWEAVERLNSPMHAVDDRRRMAVIDFDSSDARSTYRALFDAGAHYTIDVLATRGETLCLARTHIEIGESGAEAVFDAVSVVNVGPERLEHETVFDLDDIDAAFGELDRQYVETDPERASLVTVFSDVFNRRDWSAMEALYAPDVELDDHRPARFGSVRGRAALIDQWRGVVEMAPDVRHRMHHMRLGGDVLIADSSIAGSSGDAPFENRSISVLQLSTEGIVQWDWYGDDQIDEAMERFDELVAARRATDRFENRAARLAREFAELFNGRDWDGVRALHASDYHLDDRRRAIGGPWDLDAALETFRLLFDAGARYSTQVLATRGEDICLAVTHVEAGSPGEEVDFGAVIVTESSGRGLEYEVSFDIEDLDAAFEELDRRYQASSPEAAALFRGFLDAFNQRDWDLASRLHAPDAVLEDHRPARFGHAHGRDAILAVWRSVIDLSDDVSIRTPHTRRADRCLIAELSVQGTIDGAPFENRSVAVLQLDDQGAVTQWDWYGDDQREEAFGRFDELCAQARRWSRFANAAVENMEAVRVAFASRDWDAVVDRYAPNSVVDDRRRLFQHTLVGDQVLEWLRQGYDGDTTFAHELLGTRGDRLALLRIRLSSPEHVAGTIEHDRLHVIQVGEDGRRTATVYFDLDALDAAFEELDLRYLATNPAEAAGVRAFNDSFNQRDWDAVGRMYAPDVVLEDHRPARFGHAVGREALIDIWRSNVDVAPDARHRTHHVRFGHGAVIAEASVRGTTDGAPFENRAVSVFEVDGAVGITRWDWYGDDQVDEAFAHFARLTGQPAAEPFQNLAIAAADRLCEAWQRRDWDAIVATCAPNFRGVDRRAFAQVETGDARESYWGLFTLGWDMRRGPIIATRGEQLALCHWTFVSPTEGEDAELIAVEEVDDTGRRLMAFAFDVDALDAAYDELDARYLAHGGPDLSIPRRTYARDWDAFAALFEPTSVMTDHRRMFRSRRDLRGFVASQKVLAEELGADAGVRYFVYHVVPSSPRAVLLHCAITGTRDGGTFDIPFLALMALSENGRVTTSDVYDVEHLDDALARFEEVSAADEPEPFVNAAVAASDRLFQVWRTGDWDAVRAVIESYVMEDRRGFARIQPRAAAEVYRELFEVSESAFRRDSLIATRGDRLCLCKATLSFRDGVSGLAEVDGLGLVEIDEAGGLRTGCIFEMSQLDAAYAELDARYLAGEGASASWFVESGLPDALSRQDWDAVTAAFSTDFVVTSHQPLSLLTASSRDDYVGSLRVLIEQAPDASMQTRHLLAAEGDFVLAVAGIQGAQSGGDFEILVAVVAQRGRDAPFGRFDIYDVEQLDDARALYDSLVSRSRPEPFTNLAVAATDGFCAAWATHDWDRVRACMAPGYHVEDRRAFAQFDSHSPDDVYRPLFGLTESEFRRDALVATRGDRLALTTMAFTFRDGASGLAEADWLCITEVDADGRTTGTVAFDLSDLDAAYDELDARYLAGQGAVASWFLNDFAKAVRRRDWEAATAMLDPDFVVESHQPFGVISSSSRDEYIGWERTLVERSPEAVMRARHIVAATRDCALVVGVIEGDDFEIPVVVVLRRGRQAVFSRFDIYDLEQLNEARSLYDSLVAGYAGSPFANAAVRMRQRASQALLDRDWDAVIACLTTDVVLDDRRSLFRHQLRGEEALAWWRSAMEHVSENSQQLLATRGDRLALFCDRGSTSEALAGPTEYERLVVDEVDEEGRRTAIAYIDADDLDAAYEELNARYLAGEGAPHADWITLARAFDAGVAAANWSAVEDLFTHDFSVVDHRSMALTTIASRAEYMDSLRVLHAEVPDLRQRINHIPAISREYGLVVGSWEGTAAGGPVQVPVILVVQRRGKRFSCFEAYEHDQLDEARARYETLTAAPGLPDFTNAAVRSRDRATEAYRAGAWDDFVATCAPDLLLDDRRSMFRHQLQGEQAFAWFRAAFGQLESGSRDLIATRGDRLALFRVRGRSKEGIAGETEYERLVLDEIDDDGQRARITYFDVDDLDAAFAELDARYRTHTGSDLGRLARAFRSRDWEEFRALFAPMFVLDDRRRLGLGVADVNAYVAYQQSIIDISPDARSLTLHVLDEVPGLRLTISGRAGSRDGGDFEIFAVALTQTARDSLIERLTLFDIEDVDEARAHFDQAAAALARPSPVRPERFEELRRPPTT